MYTPWHPGPRDWEQGLSGPHFVQAPSPLGSGFLLTAEMKASGAETSPQHVTCLGLHSPLVLHHADHNSGLTQIEEQQKATVGEDHAGLQRESSC